LSHPWNVFNGIKFASQVKVAFRDYDAVIHEINAMYESKGIHEINASGHLGGHGHGGSRRTDGNAAPLLASWWHRIELVVRVGAALLRCSRKGLGVCAKRRRKGHSVNNAASNE